jgi:alginate O-acetyltransferase complex protein AlgI
MLFHSYEFIFGFLPLCFLVFGIAVHTLGWQAGLIWLGIASVFFYGQWGLPLAAFLVGSIVANYGFALAIERFKNKKAISGRIFLLAVVSNLAFLGYFKYMNFFIDNINLLSGTNFSHIHVLFVVGVSFYTFVQIGYLIELYTGQGQLVKFHQYFLFSCFFPCVTAGPLLLQKEMMPQIVEKRERLFDKLRLATGLTVFSIGLFKKLVLADSIAPFADAVFDGAAAGASVDAVHAWVGALAYTLQLYFDFSGYSDMAIGVGYLFGFRLPLNFNSPLKACSIVDFWRRWHMTMTRFFTNYLYMPIGITMMRRAIKGRHTRVRRFAEAVAFPVLVTFILAGVWHGAGWTFVVFGIIHGVALACNHAWREAAMPKFPPILGWFATMAVVVSGLVVFRSADMLVALTILGAMSGIGSVAVSASVEAVSVDIGMAAALILLWGGITLLFPNTQELMRRQRITTEEAPSEEHASGSKLSWRPTPAWAAATVVLLVFALGFISGETSFIYYKF